MDRFDPNRRAGPTDLDELSRELGIGPSAQTGRRERKDRDAGLTPRARRRRPRPQFTTGDLWATLAFVVSVAIISTAVVIAVQEWTEERGNDPLPVATPTAAEIAVRRPQLAAAAETLAVGNIRVDFGPNAIGDALDLLSPVVGSRPVVSVAVVERRQLTVVVVDRDGSLRRYGTYDTVGSRVPGRTPNATFKLSDVNRKAPVRVIARARSLGTGYEQTLSSLTLRRGTSGALQWHGRWTGQAEAEAVADAQGNGIRKAS